MAKKYSFADHPEHKAQLTAHHEKWLRVPLDCTPLDDASRAKCEEAVREMYRFAAHPEPRIVFVPSPFVAAFASGFAAAIWYRRSAATDAATDAATRAATDAATDAATYAATLAATDAATYAATDAATDAATLAATDAATYAATDAATYAATYAATRDATDAATLASTEEVQFLLLCAAKSWRLVNGGNLWSAWVEYLAFGDEVAERTDIDFSRLEPYKTLCILSGPRYVHERFCIISDKPEFIKGYWRDGVFIAHCDDGPSHKWRDGSCIYTWHGRQIGWRFGARSGGNPDIIDHPETITVAAIQSEPNAEIRRAMIAKFGAARYLREANATLVHEDEFGKLWRCARPGDTPIVMLECRNGSPEPIGYAPTDGESGEWVGNRWYKHYMLRVPPTTKTARKAEAWIHGLASEDEYAPAVRT